MTTAGIATQLAGSQAPVLLRRHFNGYDWTGSIGHHVLGNASDDYSGQSRFSMCSHYDQVD